MGRMLFLITVLGVLSSAQAWDSHHVIYERILETRASKKRLYPYLKIKVPCPEEEKREIETIAKDLDLNPKKIPVFSEGKCGPNQPPPEVIFSDLMVGTFPDEPDQGMDQNLPESSDPNHYRKWMGGTAGPTSQGFRHMYFPGVDWKHPASGLQIPIGPIGELLDRIRKLKAATERYNSIGNKFWAARTMLWELHYVQDLFQPFHVNQVPSLRMLPWSKLFSGFIQASTRSISNYHYAYEGLSLALMKESETNDFQKCFEPGEREGIADPAEMVPISRAQAGNLGKALVDVFGKRLKDEKVDLANGQGDPDYFAILHAKPAGNFTGDEKRELTSAEIDLNEEQMVSQAGVQTVKGISCKLMQEMSTQMWAELDRVFLKASRESTSSNTGK